MATWPNANPVAIEWAQRKSLAEPPPWEQLLPALSQLQASGAFPLAAVRTVQAFWPAYADQVRAAFADLPLHLERRGEETWMLHILTGHLLAEHRDEAAVPALRDWLALDPDSRHELLDVSWQETYERWCAASFGPSEKGRAWLDALARDTQREVGSRLGAAGALRRCCFAGLHAREAYTGLCRAVAQDIADHGCVGDPLDGGNPDTALALLLCDWSDVGMDPDAHGFVRDLYARGLVDETVESLGGLLRAKPLLARMDDGLPGCTVEELKGWGMFRVDEPRQNRQQARQAVPVTQEPSVVPVRTSPKTGRNDPCPCGSGKKFKKCCGA